MFREWNGFWNQAFGGSRDSIQWHAPARTCRQCRCRRFVGIASAAPPLGEACLFTRRGAVAVTLLLDTD
ncbi:hypothetical protein XAC2852_820034 [Xanthomonas citri pv. citri]|nr:hypothetical protein XAC9322_740034 [Xanthomonas citri pv. citri]CEE82018.1 hypothetical protein XAC2852_820034 [Xanthomonas citri pv. citri]CEE86526.1 hypothetical protein XACLC80_940034 [Xanthomonas citri pv. citri]CEF47273.1 hypothetical protein XAC217_830034 [Xanthomonas citri pv. citri]CEH44830.1 hypothetical protein XAC3610_10190004 [Xanthomonas citri pv. citri]